MRLRLPLALALALAVTPAPPAHGHPAPDARSIPIETLRPLGLETARAEAGPGSVCGTRIESAAEALLRHLERADLSPAPSPLSTDTLGIAVLEDDGTFFFLDKNNNPNLDLASVTRAFYGTHGDDYDFLAIYLASGLSAWLGSPTALAAAYVIRNTTQGIGLDPYDLGPGFGSPARLETILSMNGLAKYPADPDSNIGGDTFSTLDVLAHEFGHRWLAYTFVDSAGNTSPALLGRDWQHWNFFLDADSSLEEGCNWARIGPDSFRTDGVSAGFGALDLYLMGLRTRAETDSFFVVNDPTSFDPPGTYVPYTSPFVGLGCRGRATWWHVSDIEAVHGPRVPDASVAPHVFRVAFVLVTARDSAASAADLAKLGNFRARFGPYFAAATQGFGAVDLSLASQAGRVHIAHAPLHDTEDALSPRPVGARVTIAQGGIRIAVDPSSARAFWRPVGAGPFTAIPLGPAGADSFAGTLPALPSGGPAEYYLYAASDSAGIEAFDPPAGPAAPHAYAVGPDLTPPVIAHVPVHRQGAGRLPQTLIARVTDNLGVDSVWVEVAVDGGPPSSVACTPAGRDSFAAAIGAGVLPGQRVASRFAARDRAAAHNLATSNPAYDTLAVELDWTDDFENGPAGWTHSLYWYSYRDAWHLTQEASSPSGGTAWKCGADAPLPYPPHLDANLYTPVLSGIVSGTTLGFDQRYELEEAGGVWAWDGARLEISVNGGAYQVLTPQGGYPRAFYSNSNPFQRGTPCWSGSSGGWHAVSADLSPYAPGPVRIRFRMLADSFLGLDGWLVDKVRVTSPGGALDVPLLTAGSSIGRAWPNPARDALRLSLVLPRAAEVEWSLYDVAGRRVAMLWKGNATPGASELRTALPRLGAGLYFARLTLDGREAASQRIAIIR